jgi:regulator of sirC expression with transglutaminase-like and TPR domain
MTGAGDSFREALAARFAGLADGDHRGELDAALLVTQALAPDVSLAALELRLEQLTSACDSPDTPWAYLRGLGYAGAAGQRSVLVSSRLDQVLERRVGIPISLGVLLIHLARSQGLDAWGVNFPGHFLVEIGTQLVDPFAMEPVTAETCLTQLPPTERRSGVDPLARASVRQVALRMLNNVKYQLAGDSEWHAALDMVDYQLALAEDPAPLLLERASFWLRLGGLAAARASLERCLELDTLEHDIRSAAKRQLQALSGETETLH